jgi:hypothetical protein
VAWCAQCLKQLGDDELVAGPGEPGPIAGPAGAPGTRDRCPSCGTRVVAPAPVKLQPGGGTHPDELAEGAEGEAAEETKGHAKAPWHFKVLVTGSVIYLGYRLYQGIGWLVHHG